MIATFLMVVGAFVAGVMFGVLLMGVLAAASASDGAMEQHRARR